MEYSDFNCGFCRRFYDETLQRIVDEYVATGKVRFSYKHYPFLAPSSTWKAEAAECAAAQGRFWDYHEKLFTTNIAGEDEVATKRALTDLAAELRLDVAVFTACLSAGDARRQVEDDAEEGCQGREGRKGRTEIDSENAIVDSLKAAVAERGVNVCKDP